MTADQVISRLHELAKAEVVSNKKIRFGVSAENTLGVYQKDLKPLAIEIGKNDQLAIQLFNSGIYEARILCSKVFDPKNLTEELMEKWVKTFENWEICDSFSMGLFAKSRIAVKKINEWSSRKPVFEKRSAFATMAAYCMADKFAGNEVFEAFFPIIKREANDERLYVKKAVNWVLRNIGKRNVDLNKKARQVANELIQTGKKTAIWIAKDAIRELESDKVNILDYPRNMYRK